MRKVILVQPKAGYLEFINSKPVSPVGLLSISAVTCKHYPIKIIDQRVNKNWNEHIEKELDEDPLCIGLTSFTGIQLDYMLKIADFVKQKSKIPVVLGGIHASILPEQSLKEECIDYIIQGEGDLSFPKFVEAIDGKSAIEEVEGLFLKEDGQVMNSNPSRAIKNLDELPSLPYDLVDVENYVTIDKKGNRRFDIQTSRGCPYDCTFCYSTKIRRNWRAFSAERTLEHIGFLYDNHRIRHFRIFDDNFFVDLKRSYKIIKTFEDEKLDIRYKIDGCRIADLDRMDDEMLALLEKTGCSELQVGIEAGSDRMLKILKKGTNLEQVRRVTKRMRDYDIWIYYEFVCGHPHETPEDLEMTTDLALFLVKENPNAFISPLDCLTPYPGTELYKQSIEYGFNSPESIREWSKWQWDHFKAPWFSDEDRKKT